MSTRLYVGGIPYRTTEDAMREAFAQAGEVTSVKIIIDRMTGRSRGFGFVEMSTDEETQKAITTLNGTELDGRTLTVNEAKPMEKGREKWTTWTYAKETGYIRLDGVQVGAHAWIIAGYDMTEDKHMKDGQSYGTTWGKYKRGEFRQ